MVDLAEVGRTLACQRRIGFEVDDEAIDRLQAKLDEEIEAQNEPYRRLPRIAYWLDRPLGRSGLTFGLDSELVAFDRDVGVTGARVDLFPNLYWDRYHRWGFIKPRVGYRYRAYHLDYQGQPGDESPAVGTTIASLDAGLVFDRATGFLAGMGLRAGNVARMHIRQEACRSGGAGPGWH